MFLIQIDRDQFEVDRRVVLQIQQDVEQRVGVFAARQTHHNLVAVLDHAVIDDCVACLASQLLLQLVGRKIIPARRSTPVPCHQFNPRNTIIGGEEMSERVPSMPTSRIRPAPPKGPTSHNHG